MLKLILVSDYPAKKTFQSIYTLRSQISNYGVTIFEVFFNEYKKETKDDIIKNMIDANIIIISLIKDNLGLLLKDDFLIDKMLNEKSVSSIYIFGAPSQKIGKIAIHQKVHYFSRAGVSKTSREFKNAILDEIISTQKKPKYNIHHL